MNSSGTQKTVETPDEIARPREDGSGVFKRPVVIDLGEVLCYGVTRSGGIRGGFTAPVVLDLDSPQFGLLEDVASRNDAPLKLYGRGNDTLYLTCGTLSGEQIRDMVDKGRMTLGVEVSVIGTYAKNNGSGKALSIQVRSIGRMEGDAEAPRDYRQAPKEAIPTVKEAAIAPKETPKEAPTPGPCEHIAACGKVKGIPCGKAPDLRNPYGCSRCNKHSHGLRPISETDLRPMICSYPMMSGIREGLPCMRRAISMEPVSASDPTKRPVCHFHTEVRMAYQAQFAEYRK